MNTKTYFLVSGIIFFLVFLLHVLRLVLGWEAVIGGCVVPMWASIGALFVAGFLTYSAFKFFKQG
ncbi:MAG TPA: hypothetical protein VJB34_05605 [Bdellovibrionota bacterium]|nr:hypothetical protein [Bdellovibrionota bacterium]